MPSRSSSPRLPVVGKITTDMSIETSGVDRQDLQVDGLPRRNGAVKQGGLPGLWSGLR